jgi:multidrug efflux pump subunit AcrB
MAQFFIDRPVFAWVIALFVLLAGAVAIIQLPVAQYPPVAPPTIIVNVAYPGASAKTLESSVLTVIEREMNGSPGLIYMESVSQANGSGALTLTFESGTNPELAQVDVQNRLSRAAPRLPQAVTQQGVRVDKSRSNFLLFTILSSDDPKFDPIALGDYASRNVLPEIQRIPGVGQAQLFGTERAMRVWIDPAKLVGFNLSASDVNAAIRAQNAQVSSGTIGDLPNLPGQTIFATVVVNGQLTSVEEFGSVVLRANADGSAVHLRDVARIELGAENYATAARLNGKPSTGIGVQLSPTGNALATAKAVRERMEELQRYFPPGVKYSMGGNRRRDTRRRVLAFPRQGRPVQRHDGPSHPAVRAAVARGQRRRRRRSAGAAARAAVRHPASNRHRAAPSTCAGDFHPEGGVCRRAQRHPGKAFAGSRAGLAPDRRAAAPGRGVRAAGRGPVRRGRRARTALARRRAHRQLDARP